MNIQEINTTAKIYIYQHELDEVINSELLVINLSGKEPDPQIALETTILSCLDMVEKYQDEGHFLSLPIVEDAKAIPGKTCGIYYEVNFNFIENEELHSLTLHDKTNNFKNDPNYQRIESVLHHYMMEHA